MGFALLQQWARAQYMHDRVRLSNGRPADVLLPDVNIVHIKRCSPVHPKHLRRQAEELGAGFRCRVLANTETPRPAAMELTRELSVPEVLTWLQEDISELISVFGEQLGHSQVSAKLEVLGSTPCPRFHADHVGVRLLVTYYGPGTLFVENRHIRRRWLWGSSGGGGVAVEAPDAAAARQAAAADLLFLKGHSAEGNYGMGAVHRSPDLYDVGDKELQGPAQPLGGWTWDWPDRLGGGIGGVSVAEGRRHGPGITPDRIRGAPGAVNKTQERHERLEAHDFSQPLRLLLTVDDVVGHANSECRCGRVHRSHQEGRWGQGYGDGGLLVATAALGKGEVMSQQHQEKGEKEEEAGAHRPDASYLLQPPSPSPRQQPQQ